MNVYFIVEGRRTEKKVYPAWLGHLIPELRRVNWAFEADNNNYYLFILFNFLLLDLKKWLKKNQEVAQEVSRSGSSNASRIRG